MQSLSLRSQTKRGTCDGVAPHCPFLYYFQGRDSLKVIDLNFYVAAEPRGRQLQ